MNATIEPLSNQHCDTGENPLWNPDDGCVYWTDIPAGVLYRYDPATKQTTVCYRGDPVGGFTHQADGKLLLFRVRDIATLDIAQGHVTSIIQMNWNEDDIPRFNDVHADPTGRVYAGTMGRRDRGGVFRIERDGSFKQLFAGTGCSNGIAFSRDERTMYWTDTSHRTIYRFAYDRETGELTDRAEHYACPKDEAGWPDGMAIDDADNLYSARWDGWGLVVIDPSGKKSDEIRMPVKTVSSAFFGGGKLDELFVTTANGGKPTSKPEDGTLYRVGLAGVRGRPAYRSRIRL